jgi:UDP-glucose 4-epimerase
VDGTRRLLQAARAASVERFIFLSSVQAMGDTAATCVDETAPSRPATPYGRSKLEAEGLVLDEKNGLPHAVCLRPPLVYGPGQKGNLDRMIRAVDRGLFPPLPDVGNKRSMVHVHDVIDAVLLAAARPEANRRCYIVTDGRAYSSREIHSAIAGSLGKAMPSWHVPLGALRAMARGGDWIGRVQGRRFMFDSEALEKLVGSAWYSSERISRELGFRATLDLTQALPEIVSLYRLPR